MNTRKAAALVTALVALGGGGTALACGDDIGAHNLVANPRVKADLTAAFVRAHPEISPARISGPVAGRTYYGSAADDRYAVVTFTVDTHLRYPTILMRHDNRPDRWHVVRETRGGICGRFVPQQLLARWAFRQWQHTDCYVEPA
jgi:hypothetical protein